MARLDWAQLDVAGPQHLVGSCCDLEVHEWRLSAFREGLFFFFYSVFRFVNAFKENVFIGQPILQQIKVCHCSFNYHFINQNI